MKKVINLGMSFIAACALVCVFSVAAFAAASPVNESSLVASGTPTKATVTGSVNSSSGCVAVAVALFDTDGTTVLRTQSAAVLADKTFLVEFDNLALTVGATHTIKVADYVGSDWSTKSFTVIADHQHDFGTDWKSDATNHWHECTCGEKANVAAHTFGDWKETKAATATEAGSKERVCSVCNYKETATIAATGTSGKTSSTTAKTGDTSNMLPWAVLLLASGGAVAAFGVARALRKRGSDNNRQ